MSASIEGDDALFVRFYEKAKIKPKGETLIDMVSVSSPAMQRQEFHARADTVSHWDEQLGRQITYAERFAPQYADYLAGRTAERAERAERLTRELAALNARHSTASDDEIARAAAVARSDVSGMDDAALRDHIFDLTGKHAPGNAKRETLERIAQEAAGE